MKICPRCDRTYADDTLVFCLDDGTSLSLLHGPDRRDDADKTAIMPARMRPTEASPIARATTPSPQPEKRGNRALWSTVGCLAGLVVVALIGVVAFLAWNSADKSAPDTSKVRNTTPNPIQSPSTNPATAEATLPENQNWLEGVWEGEGVQTDTNTTWATRLTVREDSYSIDYPDIPCSGRWDLIDKNSSTATFTEVITKGADRCDQNSHVIVEKKNASEVSVRYTRANSRTVIATVTLSKKSG